jgi:hypothetical protein
MTYQVLSRTKFYHGISTRTKFYHVPSFITAFQHVSLRLETYKNHKKKKKHKSKKVESFNKIPYYMLDKMSDQKDAEDKMSNQKDAEKLKLVMGKARGSLSRCPFDDCGKGVANYASEYAIDSLEPWKVRLECSSCNKKWYVCRVCKGRTMAFTTPDMVSRHRHRYHATKKRKKAQDSSTLVASRAQATTLDNSDSDLSDEEESASTLKDNKKIRPNKRLNSALKQYQDSVESELEDAEKNNIDLVIATRRSSKKGEYVSNSTRRSSKTGEYLSSLEDTKDLKSYASKDRSKGTSTFKLKTGKFATSSLEDTDDFDTPEQQTPEQQTWINKRQKVAAKSQVSTDRSKGKSRSKLKFTKVNESSGGAIRKQNEESSKKTFTSTTLAAPSATGTSVTSTLAALRNISSPSTTVPSVLTMLRNMSPPSQQIRTPQCFSP